MKREKRKQREAIERIKIGVQNQERLEAENAMYDAQKPVVKQLNAKSMASTDDGAQLADRCPAFSAVLQICISCILRP